MEAQKNVPGCCANGCIAYTGICASACGYNDGPRIEGYDVGLIEKQPRISA
jgi:hypothetical protein